MAKKLNEMFVKVSDLINKHNEKMVGSYSFKMLKCLLEDAPKVEKLYMVVFDGYNQSYGSLIYCQGGFTDKKKAERACAVTNSRIIEVDIDKLYKAHCDSDGNDVNELYLGGYYE